MKRFLDGEVSKMKESFIILDLIFHEISIHFNLKDHNFNRDLKFFKIITMDFKKTIIENQRA